jgi:hypothetical protein
MMAGKRDQVAMEIPGVVDGVVHMSLDADGNLSLSVLIGGDGDRIELIVDREHAGALGAMVEGGTPGAVLPAAPCTVGVRRKAAGLRPRLAA